MIGEQDDIGFSFDQLRSLNILKKKIILFILVEQAGAELCQAQFKLGQAKPAIAMYKVSSYTS